MVVFGPCLLELLFLQQFLFLSHFEVTNDCLKVSLSTYFLGSIRRDCQFFTLFVTFFALFVTHQPPDHKHSLMQNAPKTELTREYDHQHLNVIPKQVPSANRKIFLKLGKSTHFRVTKCKKTARTGLQNSKKFPETAHFVTSNPHFVTSKGPFCNRESAVNAGLDHPISQLQRLLETVNFVR